MASLYHFNRVLPTPLETHNGFVFLLTTAWFTQANQGVAGSPVDGGATSFANGGGDLIAYTDDSFSTRIPVEIIDFVTGITPDIVMWVRLPNWSAGDTITLSKDDVQISQPPVTDTYGRNNVWQDKELVIHQGSVIDSTGNHTPTLAGTPNLVAGKWGGQAYNFSASEAIIVPHASTLNFTSEMSVFAWADASGLANPAYVVDKVDDNTDGYRLFKRNTDNSYRFRTPTTTPSNQDTAALNANEEFICVTLDSVSKEKVVFRDGAAIDTDTYTGTFSGNTADLSIGNSATADQRPFSGWLGEVWMSATQSGASYISDTRTNQNSPDTFGTSSEWIASTTSGVFIDTLVQSSSSIQSSITTLRNYLSTVSSPSSITNVAFAIKIINSLLTSSSILSDETLSERILSTSVNNNSIINTLNTSERIVFDVLSALGVINSTVSVDGIINIIINTLVESTGLINTLSSSLRTTNDSLITTSTTSSTLLKKTTLNSLIDNNSDIFSTLISKRNVNSFLSSNSGILIDVGRNSFVSSNVSSSVDNTLSVRTIRSGEFEITANGTITTVILSDFDDSNIIFITLDSIAEDTNQIFTSVAEDTNQIFTSVAEETIKEFTVYART